jgi:hypothetical protein
MGTRRQSGEGSIYPYPHGSRAYVWITTNTGRRQRKYVSGKTRDEVREKYLALHQAARRGPVVSSVPTLARYLEGWLTDVVRPLSPRRRLPTTRSSAACTSFPALVPSALTSFRCATYRSGSTDCGSSASAALRGKTPGVLIHGAAPSVAVATKSRRIGRFIRPGACFEAP